MEKNRRSFIKRTLGVLAGLSLLPVSKLHSEPKENLGLDPFLGEISLYSFNFAPIGWLPCDGRLLSITSNSALFSLVGTYYGGNGTTNFGLPNLQGRVAMGYNNTYTLGSTGGSETVALTTANLPTHSHSLFANSNPGNAVSPVNNFPAVNIEGINSYATTSNNNMNAGAIGTTGNGTAHNNMQPYTALNYCIATSGIYPSRP